MANLFEGTTLFFTVPALIGSGVFILKLVLMLLSGLGGDFDTDVDADVDVGGVDADSTAAFKLLSIQIIAAFLMGFGFGGLAARFGLEWTLVPSVLAGIGFGLFLMWLISMIMKFIYDLRSSGNIDIRRAVGLEGVVYTQIPEHGKGRGSVRIVVGQSMRIFNAISEGDLIPSQTRVQVTRVNGDNSLTVVAL